MGKNLNLVNDLQADAAKICNWEEALSIMYDPKKGILNFKEEAITILNEKSKKEIKQQKNQSIEITSQVPIY